MGHRVLVVLLAMGAGFGFGLGFSHSACGRALERHHCDYRDRFYNEMPPPAPAAPPPAAPSTP